MNKTIEAQIADLELHQRVALRKLADEAVLLNALNAVSPNAADHVHASMSEIYKPSLARFLELFNSLPSSIKKERIVSKMIEQAQDAADLRNIHLAERLKWARISKAASEARALKWRNQNVAA